MSAQRPSASSDAAPDAPPADQWTLYSPRTTRGVNLVVVGIYAGIATMWTRRGTAGALMMWGFAALMAVIAARRPARLGRGRELAILLLTFGVVLAGLSAPDWIRRW